MEPLSSVNTALQLASKAMTALNAVRERAQRSQDTELKLHISTLYDQLLALKEVIVRTTEENAELRKRAYAEKRRPELRRVGIANFYFDGEKGPYCQPCYDCNNGRLAMLTEPEDW